MEKLRKMRLQKGLSARELAEKSGVSMQTVYNYEGDRRQPQLAILQKIAAALDCSLSDLID